MKVSNRLKKFFQRPTFKILLTLIIIITFLYNTWDFFFFKDTESKKNTGLATLSFFQNPLFTEVNIKPLFYYHSLPTLTFKVKDAIPKKSIVFWNNFEDSLISWRDTPITNEDMDSIIRNYTKATLSGLSFFANLVLKLKNTGDVPLEIVFIQFRSSLKFSTYELRNIYNVNSQPSQMMEFSYLRNKTILKDSLDSLLFTQFPIPFPSDTITRKAILHILIIYRDLQNNYYDSYFWVACKIKDPPDYKIEPYMYFDWEESESAITANITPYITVKPLLKPIDFIEIIEWTSVDGYALNETQTENVLAFLLK